MFLFASLFAKAESVCAPFRVHNKVRLPAAPKSSDLLEFSKMSEEDLIKQIGNIKTQNQFPHLYRNWLLARPFEMTPSERLAWLKCAYYYVRMDTNGNGIPDWEVLNDQKPSRVFYPHDPDQDGDGVENVFDVDPLNAKLGTKISKKQIPLHLQSDDPETKKLQAELFKEFKLLAIDHTDQHSPIVLKHLLLVLRNGFPKNFGLENLKYIYAFAGHDPARNAAAYHLKAEALSVGGLSSYSSDANVNDLTAALIHEIGHAILFEKMTAQQLSDISVQFAGWSPIDPHITSFYDISFFKSYSLPDRKNIVSSYSMKNRHEWFAESFSAALMNKLNQRGLIKTTLLPKWESSTKQKLNPSKLSADLQQWMEGLLIQ